MIWLYYNWVILLTGAKISFYHQFPVLLRMRDDRLIYGEWYMQRLVVIVMYVIGYDYLQGQRRLALPALMELLRIPKSAIQRIIEALERNRLILRIDSDKSFVPARDIETITLGEIVNSVKGEFPVAYSPLNDFVSIPEMEKIMSDAQDAFDNILAQKTLKELVASHTLGNKETI